MPLLRMQQFQIHLPGRKILYFKWSSIDKRSLQPHWQEISYGSSNGSVVRHYLSRFWPRYLKSYGDGATMPQRIKVSASHSPNDKTSFRQAVGTWEGDSI